MEFFDAAAKRRSVRRYKPAPVPEDVMRKILDTSLIAPNSSNMQPWEFYWVRTAEKKAALAKACLSQPAATTAPELVVAVARTDTWKRNQKLMLEILGKAPNVPASALQYYSKLVPMVYVQGPFSVLGLLKRVLFFFAGLTRPVPRGPFSHSELFESVVKTTALACENFMLAATALGYGSCPMEGFDEVRVKKLLGLGRRCRVVMVLSVGETDPAGIYGPQIRFDKKLFIHEV